MEKKNLLLVAYACVCGASLWPVVSFIFYFLSTASFIFADVEAAPLICGKKRRNGNKEKGIRGEEEKA